MGVTSYPCDHDDWYESPNLMVLDAQILIRSIQCAVCSRFQQLETNVIGYWDQLVATILLVVPIICARFIERWLKRSSQAPGVSSSGSTATQTSQNVAYKSPSPRIKSLNLLAMQMRTFEKAKRVAGSQRSFRATRISL